LPTTAPPMARTPMTEGLFSESESAFLSPEAVTPAVLLLVSDKAPSRVIRGAGCGAFAVTHIPETLGFYPRKRIARLRQFGRTGQPPVSSRPWCRCTTPFRNPAIRDGRNRCGLAGQDRDGASPAGGGGTYLHRKAGDHEAVGG